MNTELVQIVQLISSIIIPIIIILLGLKLNKTLEVNKTSLTKDKEWRTEWAKRFYSAAIEFNAAVDDSIITLFLIAQLSTEKLPGWEKRFEDKQNNIHAIFERLQRAEWILKTTSDFAPNSKDEILSHSNKIWSTLSELYERKEGNLEVIRQYLLDFNKAAMMAHREILGK
jgi:hypothetical protein